VKVKSACEISSLCSVHLMNLPHMHRNNIRGEVSFVGFC
jgi:hypothetical protein